LEVYTVFKKWDLCQGLTTCLEGTYTVYAKFYAPWGTASGIVSDSIIYRIKPPIIKILEIIKKIPEVIKKISRIIRPKPQKLNPQKLNRQKLNRQKKNRQKKNPFHQRKFQSFKTLSHFSKIFFQKSNHFS